MSTSIIPNSLKILGSVVRECDLFPFSLVPSFASSITCHGHCHGSRRTVQLLIKGMLRVWELSAFDGATFLGRVLCLLWVWKWAADVRMHTYNPTAEGLQVWLYSGTPSQKLNSKNGIVMGKLRQPKLLEERPTWILDLTGHLWLSHRVASARPSFG